MPGFLLREEQWTKLQPFSFVSEDGQVSTVVVKCFFAPDDIIRTSRVLEQNCARRLPVIARCYCGDYFFISATEPGVFFWDHDTDEVLRVAASLADFERRISKVQPELGTVEQLMRDDDLGAFEVQLAQGKLKLDGLDEYDRDLFENAAIYSAFRISQRLAEYGLDGKKALRLAESNLPLFPKTAAYVEHLRDIVSRQGEALG